MKKMKFSALGLLVGAIALTACSNEDEDHGMISPVPTVDILDIDAADITYNADGVWTGCFDYNPPITSITVGDYAFTHIAGNSEWGGVNYPWWGGFCPSKVNDTANYSIYDEATGTWDSSAWTSGTWHTWASITGGGVAGPGTAYMVADWNVTPDVVDPLVISRTDGATFVPVTVYLTNATYGYYLMKYGSNFSRAFTDEDWCKVIITGYDADGKEYVAEHYLACDGKISDTWETVDLSAMGAVNRLVFSMESSDSGQWGMNNPAFFCLDGFTTAVL